MTRRILKLPPKQARRTYTDKQMAYALQVWSETKNPQLASEKTGVPRSTLNQWRSRYLLDEEFAQRIDTFLVDVLGTPHPLSNQEPS